MSQKRGQVSLVCLMLVCNASASQLSLVDPSFGVGSGTDQSVNALYVQPDQRILVGGEFTAINGQSSPHLARLNSDGSVDSSFNLQGVTDGQVYCLLGLPNGNVVVGGAFDTIQGASRHGIARLTANGTFDPSFDAGTQVDGTAFGVAAQDDGRIWVSTSSQPAISRVLRLQTNGAADSTCTSTNDFDGYIFALLPLSGGGVLVGVNPQTDGTKPALVSLLADGRLDTNYNSGLGSNSSVLTLVREADGHVLVGGLLRRPGQPGSVPLARLTSDLRLDDSFQADAFKGDSSLDAVVDSLLVQPDGKIVAGGYFFEVGGYSRREVVRLSSDGRVDPCFDPGLGLGLPTPAGSVRALALQSDGRILLGGFFDGIDEASQQHNLARLLPQGPCDAIRAYLVNPGGNSSLPHFFAAATFPPGGTNIVETSTNLQDWHELARDTAPYIYVDSGALIQTVPSQFFRARQQH